LACQGRAAAAIVVVARCAIHFFEAARTSVSTCRKAIVLIVDDEPRIRNGLATALHDAHFAVIEVANADEALNILRNGVTVNIVLSDILMPGSIDGIGLANIVAKDYPAVRVFLTSGYPQTKLPSHIRGFFLKPVQPAELVRHLDALIV
jgi:YesN/AraC family two-component response regulator